MFPSSTGGLRCPSSLHKAWLTCLHDAKVEGRFTVHGLRRTFVDLARRARVDGVVTCSLTGHVTEKMRIYYSTVEMDDRRAAVTAVAELLRPMGDREGDRSRECSDPIEPRHRQVPASVLETAERETGLEPATSTLARRRSDVGFKWFSQVRGARGLEETWE
jgi:hypothetical protein